MTKYCIYCKDWKPHNKGAKLSSKASGFQGARCWDCWIKHSREYQAARAAAKNREWIEKCHPNYY